MKKYIRANKELSFEEHEGLGKNPSVLHLSNGDEVKIENMSYIDIGDNRKDLPLTDKYMLDHYTEDFTLYGVGKMPYLVTREVIIRNRQDPKHCRWTSKIVKVQQL